jgi:hypothetical protein
MVKAFLVFYGYLSLSFGWVFYIVVFLSLLYAIYIYIKSKDFFETAEGYIKAITILGTVDLTISLVVATFLTVRWLVF